jgi:ubiquinone/menaquinone biosynthesis C-methylase UbiE
MVNTKKVKIWHNNSDLEWERFGYIDPYYGVMVHDKFRKYKLNDKGLNEFFNSGFEHIKFIFESIQKSVNPKFNPSSALDFGCGVGRCAIPLATICHRVVGVDIASSMLEEARKNSMKNNITNLELIKSDDSLSQISGQFDFIHSFSTFQHISQKRGYKIFSRLTELLSDNGVAAIEFLYHHKNYGLSRVIGSIRKNVPFANNIFNLIYKRPFAEPLMEKNMYRMKKLMTILRDYGCGNLHLKLFENNDLRNVILFFQKKKDNVPILDFLNS